MALEGGDEELVSLLGDAEEQEGCGPSKAREGAHRRGPAAASHAPAAGGRRREERAGPPTAAGDAACGDDPSASSLHNFWHRAGWLVFLLMCQSTSSVILEHFQLLIQSHPTVIYFLTMLVGAGGNAGGQSTVLVVRRLAVATVGGADEKDGQRFSLRTILSTEVFTGARLACVLFCASVVRCIAFQVKGVECIAICLSMLVIVFTSVVLGSALPLVLRRFHVDPAHAGAAIQVVMDISGVALTCVVSCLVLGLPLSGSANAVTLASAGQAASVASSAAAPLASAATSAAAAATAAASAATASAGKAMAASAGGISVEHEGARLMMLKAFGNAVEGAADLTATAKP